MSGAGGKIALRMDDVGASSKRYEVYSKRWRGLGNILFLKRLPYFRAWGPYAELQADDWDGVFECLERHGAKLTVAVTAAWVEHDGTLVPYPEKWPQAYRALKRGVDRGLIRVACHGLTHCVLQDRAFLPRAFTSNRSAHREFWDWLPDEVHQSHLVRARQILDDAFGVAVTTLVPPGNVFSGATVAAARDLGFGVINCQTQGRAEAGLRIVGNDDVAAFHDREVVLYGLEWLENMLCAHAGKDFVFVDEL
jgi:peptidoglycan/xylan/chitin deacetylase (PgdA/CDA1 family)